MALTTGEKEAVKGYASTKRPSATLGGTVSELRRKAENNIPLSNPTEASQKQYNELQQQIQQGVYDSVKNGTSMERPNEWKSSMARDYQLQMQEADVNSPLNIMNRQQAGSDEHLAMMEGYMKQSAEAQMAQQKAMMDDALAQQLSGIESSYNQAVADGEMSVREAQDAFDASKAQIEQQAYLDSQNTQLTAEDRGIQNSQQMLGLMQGDNARKNTMINTNMSERDSRINTVKDRINQIKLQKGLDVSSANSTHDYGLANAQGQVDQRTADQMMQMRNQDYSMGREQSFALDQQALGQQYNKQNMNYQNELQMKQADRQQEMTLEQFAVQQGYNLANMSVQQKNQLQQMAVGQGYNITNMGIQQKNEIQKMGVQQKMTLEQFAVQQGYNLATMSVQQKNQLEQMAVNQGYTIDNANMQQKMTLEQYAVQQGYNLETMTYADQIALGQMATQNGYNVSMAGIDFNNSYSLNNQQSQLAMNEAKVASDLAIENETKAYDLAVTRELAKYDNKNSPEYKIRVGQLNAGREQMITELVTQAQVDATMKYNLGTPVEEPKKPKRDFWQWDASWAKEQNSYNDRKNAYDSYIKKLNDPMSMFP